MEKQGKIPKKPGRLGKTIRNRLFAFSVEISYNEVEELEHCLGWE